MSIEEKVQEAKDYAVEQAEKVSAVADAKADSWIMSAAKWMASFRFSWGFLVGGVVALLVIKAL